jgi:hypothetical protein
MLKLMENCTCPQKSIYIILGILWIIFNLGFLIGSRKNKNINKALKIYIISIFIIILIYKLLEYLCSKNYNTIAWIIVSFEFIGYFTLGIIFGDNIENIKFLI